MSKADEIRNKIQTKTDPRQALFTGEKEITSEGNVNINMDNNANAAEEAFNLDDILGMNQEDKKTKELVGIYFDPEVRKALEKVNKEKGRGAKSDFVNNITKWALKQKGYLK